MKQKLLFSLLICFGLTGSIIAQENIVKLGISDLLFTSLNLEYERVLNDNSSVLFEVGTQFPRTVPDVIVTTSTEPGTESNVTATSAEYKSFSVAGSYRIFTKKEGAKGFYFGPYLRYSKYDLDIEGRYDNAAINAENIPATIIGDLGVFSVGGEIGMQWLINDKIAINWNIIGLGASFNSVGIAFSSEDNDVFEEWERDVQEFLDELPADFGGNFSLTSDNATKSIKADASFPFISFRASVSIGYAF